MLRNTKSTKCPYCGRRTKAPRTHLAESPGCGQAHLERAEEAQRKAVEAHIAAHGYTPGNIVIVTAPGSSAKGVMGIEAIVDPYMKPGSFVVVEKTMYEQAKRWQEEYDGGGPSNG